MESFLYYAEFLEFWQRFRPLTPLGKAIKEKRKPIVQAQVLETIWDQTEQAWRLLKTLETASLNKIAYHLKRIPRLPSVDTAIYDESEIFAVKKFIYNYRMLFKLLPDWATTAFSLEFELAPLEALLSKGRQYAETFFIADEYSPALREVRNRIHGLDKDLETERHARLEQISSEFGLNFGVRQFLTVNKAEINPEAPAIGLLSIEPYDETRYLVRPGASAAELRLKSERQALQNQERRLEHEILVEIAQALHRDLPILEEYSQALAQFDLSLASANLAEEYQLVRPQVREFADSPSGCGQFPVQIGSDNSSAGADNLSVSSGEGIAPEPLICVVKGRFIPCEEYCQTQKKVYQPLDFSLTAPCTMIFGSNMGGKTIALKTLAFLQLCTQYGLFVSAERFSTHIFETFHYIGEDPQEKAESRQGLSGFGFEIRQFCEAWAKFNRPALALFDEFARTTNSGEAEALISAISRKLLDNSMVAAVFSTHFRGITRWPGAVYLRMKGLNREKLAKMQNKCGNDAQEQPGLENRPEACEAESENGSTNAVQLGQVNDLMDYCLVPDDPALKRSDALEIAGLLGLDPDIVHKAEELLLN